VLSRLRCHRCQCHGAKVVLGGEGGSVGWESESLYQAPEIGCAVPTLIAEVGGTDLLVRKVTAVVRRKSPSWAWRKEDVASPQQWPP